MCAFLQPHKLSSLWMAPYWLLIFLLKILSNSNSTGSLGWEPTGDRITFTTLFSLNLTVLRSSFFLASLCLQILMLHNFYNSQFCDSLDFFRVWMQSIFNTLNVTGTVQCILCSTAHFYFLFLLYRIIIKRGSWNRDFLRIINFGNGIASSNIFKHLNIFNITCIAMEMHVLVLS